MSSYVENVMAECSMPLEISLDDFKIIASETNEDVFGPLLNLRTKNKIFDYYTNHRDNNPG